jgi:HD-GYP domain-containing protein (c-di-GMP phosphodiesterase class II)
MPRDLASSASRITRERSAGLERLLSKFRPRYAEPMARRELRNEALVAGAFLAAAVPLAVFAPGHGSPSPLVFLLLVALYAVASRIEFDVAGGYGIPTQLVFVPMLFLLPAGTVPLLVAAGMVAGRLPAFVSRARHPDRSLSVVANSWHTIGPAIVFVVAGVHGPPNWSDWPVLLLALSAQLTADLASGIVREWLGTNQFPELQLRLVAPIFVVDVCLSPIGLGIAFLAFPHPAGALLVLPLCYLLRFFARDRQAHMKALLELSSAYRGTALLLGDVVEADDAYTGVHSRDVVALCMSVGPQLGLGEDQLRSLEFTALLHDVGKIAIPKEIINKPGRLTDEERALIETHTIEGEAMLERVGGMLGEIGRLVRSCHERYDGLGYPDGLAGEAIPIEARIVCCCDAFNAMTTDRPYRAALSLDEALGELRTHRGTQFDPRVADVLLALHNDVAPPAIAQALPEQDELLSAA